MRGLALIGTAALLVLAAPTTAQAQWYCGPGCAVGIGALGIIIGVGITQPPRVVYAPGVVYTGPAGPAPAQTYVSPPQAYITQPSAVPLATGGGCWDQFVAMDGYGRPVYQTLCR